MSHRFAIDSLAVRDGRMFGWGWLLDDDAAASEIFLCMRLPDGGECRLRCPQMGSRPDLGDAFPRLQHAAGGGFMLQGRFPASVHADTEARLEARLTDGRRIEIPLHGFPSQQQMLLSPTSSRRIRTWQLLRSGNWRGLVRRLSQWWARRMGPWRASRVTRSGAKDGSTERIVVFDHAMGGGANHFRGEQVALWRSEGHDVRVVTPELASLDYLIDEIGADGRPERRNHPDLASCLAALGTCTRVVVNDLVSFDDPLRVLEWARARQRAGARVWFYVHDFHAACPAWTLTSEFGRDCGVPADLAQCARCLGANAAPFLAMMPSLDLPVWRLAWADFLREADQIVAFSESTLRLLRRAHPGLDLGRARVEPHSIAYLGPPPPPFEPANSGGIVTIAVVGAISLHKGAAVVAEMARLIEAERLPARIVVIGSIDGVAPSPALKITGPYKTGELRELLVREQVSLAFLPSIVNETFSYVTAELMHWSVPLAVFDLGAPAERVRHYALGCIIPAVDAQTALGTLLSFHRRLARTADTPAERVHAEFP